MTVMAGQLDLLALLEPVTQARPADWSGTCEACGHERSPLNTHHIMPNDTREHGYPVCIAMNLTKNHVQYWCMVLSGQYDPPDKKCCHGAIKTHKGRATRADYLEHLRNDYGRACLFWDFTLGWIGPMLAAHGLDDHDLLNIPHQEGCK